MARVDYYDDPNAPTAQRIVPAVTAFVQNDAGEVLLERRSDNGKWGMPGGVQEIGESITETVRREVREETGIDVEVEGLVGVYTDPGHIIEFSDGEVRQEFSMCFRARPVAGTIATSDESLEVQWVSRAQLADLDVSPTTRKRLEHALAAAAAPYLA